MVLQSTLLWIGTFAMLATGAFAFLRLDGETRILSSFIASLAWAIFGFGAFDIETTGCCTGGGGNPALGLFGLGLAAVMALFFIKSWFDRGSEEIEGFS